MALGNSELLVVEYGGTARSGKGTIVGHLGEIRDYVAIDETGADYRAITKALLIEGIIEEGMPAEVIQRQLGGVSMNQLVEFAAGRQHIVQAHGFDSLYAPDVTGAVGDVSPITEVRKAVKDGFKERVRRVRDGGEHEVLAVDGRNLRPVIESIEGTRLLMSTFTSVDPYEGALRECLRRKIDPYSPEGEKILADTIKRNKSDAMRKNDPVAPDKDALVYEHDAELREAAIHRLASRMFHGDVARAREATMGTLDSPPRSDISPRALGRAAVETGRQVGFDTTPFRGYDDDPAKPREKMLEELEIIFDDALDMATSKA